MDPIELAGCVILDDYGRILLLHRAMDENSWWELPGGKIEKGESAQDAATREVHEEVGVSVKIIKALGIGAFELEEKSFNYTWFQAETVLGEPAILEPETFDDLDYFEVEDLLSLSLSPNMQVLLEKVFVGEVSFIV